MQSTRFRRSRWPLVLLLAALSLASIAPTLWMFYRPGPGGFDVSGYPYGRDFMNNWAGPRIAFSGHVRELFDLNAYQRLLDLTYGHKLPVFNWSYPPSLLALLWPLSRMPYVAALTLWLAVLGPVFIAVGAWFAPRGRKWAGAVLLTVAPACLANAAGGQNGFLTGALLLGGLQLMPRRPLLAGLLFGLLTVKPHLGLALAAALLALGCWRTIAAAAATTAALALSSVALFGAEAWRLYLTVTSTIQVQLLKGWQGFYTKAMASVMATARGDGLPFEAAGAIQGAVSLIVLGVTIWAVRRTEDWKLRAAIVVMATPLVTPYAFNYDLTAASAVIGWRLLDAGRPLSSTQLIIYMLAWLAPGLMMLVALNGPNLMAYPLLIAFASLASEVVERRGASAPTAASILLGARA